jgi:hypothetical protein
MITSIPGWICLGSTDTNLPFFWFVVILVSGQVRSDSPATITTLGTLLTLAGKREGLEAINIREGLLFFYIHTYVFHRCMYEVCMMHGSSVCVKKSMLLIGLLYVDAGNNTGVYTGIYNIIA